MAKADFVEELKNFYINVVGNPDGIEDMNYIKDKGEEYIYVTYSPRVQRRFLISGDNTREMLIDFVKFLSNNEDFEILQREECI